MEVLEAFDLTGSFRDAAVLAGCSHHTVARYVAAREAGGLLDKAAARPQLIDEFGPKVAEWVLHSRGKIRADKAHEKLLALGYEGSERTTRRAVHEAKVAFNLGQVRVHRPWVTEPGMWLQYDFGDGPVIDGRKTVLFCAWLAWSRFRVVLALRDRTAPTVFAALDVTLRRLGGCPTYALTDNEKTVTAGHIAGMAVRNTQVVSWARYYGITVHTCEPADPATKGGSESTVKIAKADLVPTDTNLLAQYGSFAELEAACLGFCEMVNARLHRVTRRAPVEMLAAEQARLHPVPVVPHTVAFGLARTVAARWSRWTTGSTRSRISCSVGKCGFGCTVKDPMSRSSSCTSDRTDRLRSPGTPGPPQAARRPSTRTSHPSRLGRWSGSRRPKTLQRLNFWPLVVARGCG